MKKLFGVLVIAIFVTLIGCNSKYNDQDGNSFSTVKIGEQLWMAENLNVDHYRNGDLIPQVKDPKEWESLSTGAWCYYENDFMNVNKYGKLYNWYAVNDPRGLAPKGWHIPTLAEFDTLLMAVDYNANALKESGQGIYTSGTNTSGFSAMLAGFREPGGDFYVLAGKAGGNAYFWSSSVYETVYASNLLLYGGGHNFKFEAWIMNSGFSVRCLKD
jgi:uncharacterized protein (TIGR02145 family)